MAQSDGEVIYTSLAGGAIGFEDGAPRAVYTTVVAELDDERLEAVRTTPCLFQQRIQKALELRVTVVGERVFAAAIDSSASTAARLDFRRAYEDLSYHVAELPEWLSDACVRLVQEFGLVYGALDIIQAHDGSYVFLELNPNGQWAWIQEATGLDIRGALIDQLVAGRG
jgi:glutathione synthase/RimK-type ligase-like ATP-grasp enzyme